MSIYEAKQPVPAVQVGTAYFTADRAPAPDPRLRDLTALEQMYGYWGSDGETAAI